jgi:hypothetical protein
MRIITRAEVINRMLTIRLMMAGNYSNTATVAPRSAAMSNKQALDVKWASACTIVLKGASDSLLGISKELKALSNIVSISAAAWAAGKATAIPTLTFPQQIGPGLNYVTLP